jgi:hypothetical protein
LFIVIVALVIVIPSVQDDDQDPAADRDESLLLAPAFQAPAGAPPMS